MQPGFCAVFLGPPARSSRPPRRATTPTARRHTAMPGPRVVALCLSAAGGVSGVGSGARPSEDAAAVVRFALEKVLRPETDVLLALHACSGVPLAPPRGAVEEPVLPDAHPEWMPRSLARAWARFRRARGAFALRLESDLDPDRALVAYLANPRLPGADAPVAVHLVVVGARGGVGAGVAADAARRLRRAVLGSVSRGVLDRTPAPVLVVRPRDARRLDHLSNDLVFTPSPTRGSPKLSAPPTVAVVGSAETCVGSPTAPSARHAREDSFPGNWRLFVPGSEANDLDEEDQPEAYPDQFDTPPGATRAIDAHGRAVFVPDAVDPELAGVEADDFRRPRPRPAEAEAEAESRRLLLPGFRGGGGGGGDGGAANVVCVAHDGGDDGAALVRWTLRHFLRPTDRALFIVHVTPVAPDALAREFNLDESGGSGSGFGAVASRLMESASDASAFLDACALTLNENNLKKQHPPPAVSCAVVGSEEGSGALLPGTGGGVAGRWAAEALLRAAVERRVDALVVGSRGRGRAGVGRAAKTCADRAPCAVVGVPSRALDAFRERRSDGD